MPDERSRWELACHNIITDWVMGCRAGAATGNAAFTATISAKTSNKDRLRFLEEQRSSYSLGVDLLGHFLSLHLLAAGFEHADFRAGSRLAFDEHCKAEAFDLRTLHAGMFLGMWKGAVARIMEAFRGDLLRNVVPKVVAQAPAKDAGDLKQAENILRGQPTGEPYDYWDVRWNGLLPIWTREEARKLVDLLVSPRAYFDLLFPPGVVFGSMDMTLDFASTPDRPALDSARYTWVERPNGKWEQVPADSVAWIQNSDGKWMAVPAQSCKWIQKPDGKWIQVLAGAMMGLAGKE